MYMNHEVRILGKKSLNHDVVQFQLERPSGYQFVAGQAIELELRAPVRRGPAPFTFTGLNTSPNLELTIKIYRDHDGLTAALERLHVGDSVSITDPWDSFTDKGPGVFIAGGAGITPFVALLRQMQVDGTVGGSTLLFANKSSKDAFLRDELKGILGNRYVDVLAFDDNGRSNQLIDEAFLKIQIQNLQQPINVCGPPGFMDAVQGALKKIGASEQAVNVSL